MIISTQTVGTSCNSEPSFAQKEIDWNNLLIRALLNLPFWTRKQIGYKCKSVIKAHLNWLPSPGSFISHVKYNKITELLRLLRGK